MFETFSFSRMQMVIVAAICGSVSGPVLAGDALGDPTRPAHFAKSAPSGTVRNTKRAPVVSAIRVSATQKVAVIDGKSYRPGDRVAGGQIVDIELYEVVLRVSSRRGGGAREVRMRLVPKLNKEPVVSKETDQ